jgi:Aerotolerance regulator N-terminal
MTFLGVSSSAACIFLAAVCVLVYLLHRLRPAPARRPVPSMLIWRRVLAREKRPVADWRRWLALILALCIALSMALALTQPQFPGWQPPAERIVIVMDNSPSMAARTQDGESRWLHAITRARAMASAAGSGSQIMVTDTMGSAPLSGFLQREEAIIALSRLPIVSFGTPKMPPAIPDKGNAEIHLFTDGVAALNWPETARVHSVFEPADNIAITAFDTRPHPQNPIRYQAFVQVLNASAQARPVRLVLRGENFDRHREVALAANNSSEESFDISDFPQGILHAEVLSLTDALETDNSAYSVVEEHRLQRVMLVRAGDALLEDALRSLPGVTLSTSAPSEYRPTAGIDLYVFDRFAPLRPPPAAALIFRAPATSWLAARQHLAANPVITSWDEEHPLSAGVAWNALRMQNALLTFPAGELAGIVTAKGLTAGDLVSTGNATAPWVHVGFAPEESNFHLQPGFVAFLGNTVHWLTRDTTLVNKSLGNVEIPLPGASVKNPQGMAVATTATPAGTLFQATRPGVYIAESDGHRLRVICNLLDPHAGQINRSRLDGTVSAAEKPADLPARWPLDPWAFLLLFAAMLLVADWATFNRRIAA